MDHILNGYCEGFVQTWESSGPGGSFSWCLQLVSVLARHEHIHYNFLCRLKHLLLVLGPAGEFNKCLVSSILPFTLTKVRQAKASPPCVGRFFILFWHSGWVRQIKLITLACFDYTYSLPSIIIPLPFFPSAS